MHPMNVRGMPIRTFCPEGEGLYEGGQYGWRKMLGTLENVLARL